MTEHKLTHKDREFTIVLLSYMEAWEEGKLLRENEQLAYVYFYIEGKKWVSEVTVTNEFMEDIKDWMTHVVDMALST